MKTYTPKAADIQRKWYILDAKDKVAGRIATVIANKLRGKDKAIFAPHMDCGDFVIVINADKVKLTGTKEVTKLYHRHSGFPGGYKNISAEDLRVNKPTEILRKAVSGMLPKNKLRKPLMQKLKLYVGSEHPHEAQSPETLEV